MSCAKRKLCLFQAVGFTRLGFKRIASNTRGEHTSISRLRQINVFILAILTLFYSSAIVIFKQTVCLAVYRIVVLGCRMSLYPGTNIYILCTLDTLKKETINVSLKKSLKLNLRYNYQYSYSLVCIVI